MKVTMKLTLEGLKRALRWKAHELAEDVEQGYRGDATDARRTGRSRRAETRERSDVRPGG